MQEISIPNLNEINTNKLHMLKKKSKNLFFNCFFIEHFVFNTILY